MHRRPLLTVLGSLNMDISVSVGRLPEPGETVLGTGAVIAPGGKGANQAVAAARLGGAVRMVGCVGADDFGTQIFAALGAEGIDLAPVRAVPGCATGLALITVDAAGENMITVAPGANSRAGEQEAAAASPPRPRPTRACGGRRPPLPAAGARPACSTSPRSRPRPRRCSRPAST